LPQEYPLRNKNAREDAMEPKIVSKEAFSVVGISIRAHVEKHDIPRLWGTLGSRVCEIQHLVQPGVAYGLTTSFDPETGEFDYVAGFGVEQVGHLPEDMGSWDVPAATYAAFTCTLPTMPEMYKHAYETWLPASGYQRARTYEFDFYDEAFDNQDPDSEFEFYIPIEPSLAD
jgi:AraC family transcriptional regulator